MFCTKSFTIEQAYHNLRVTSSITEFREDPICRCEAVAILPFRQ